mgnify:FL=1
MDDGGEYYAACYHRALKATSSLTLNDGWNLYDPISEYRRLGIIPKPMKRQSSKGTENTTEGAGGMGEGMRRPPMSFMNQKYRIYDNSNYELSPTYPAKFVVPALFSNGDVKKVAAYRSQARIPGKAQ